MPRVDWLMDLRSSRRALGEFFIVLPDESLPTRNIDDIFTRNREAESVALFGSDCLKASV